MGSGVRMSEVAGEAESRTLQHLSDSCKIRHVLVNLNEYRAQAVVAHYLCCTSKYAYLTSIYIDLQMRRRVQIEHSDRIVQPHAQDSLRSFGCTIGPGRSP